MALLLLPVLAQLSRDGTFFQTRTRSRHRKPISQNPRPKKKLRSRVQLDEGVVWHRDPATGELTIGSVGRGGCEPRSAQTPDHAIRVTSQIVPVTCGVFNADGSAITDLKRSDFRIYDDGVEQQLSYFQMSSEAGERRARD